MKSYSAFILILILNNVAFSLAPLRKELRVNKTQLIQRTGFEHLAKKNKKTVPNVTIWVHATKFLSFIGDYGHTTHRQGLVHVSEIPWGYRLKTLLETLSSADQMQFPLEHIYAFGWSGKLNFEERKKAAGDLYAAIKLMIKKYNDVFGIDPHITFITHSHGGNVVLNIPNFIEKDFHHNVTAIFLGCPVQRETKEIIHNPFFEKIYSLYSENDWIQIGDPQGFYKTESNPDRHWELSERLFCFDPKVRQVHLTINGQGIWHLGFIREYFVSVLPQLIKEIDSWQTEVASRKGQERVMNVVF